MLLVPTVNTVSAQASGPEWKLTVTPDADYFIPGPSDPNALYTIEAENVGDAPTTNSDPIVIEDSLPSGLSPQAAHFYVPGLPAPHEGGARPDAAELGLCPTALRCTYPGSLPGSPPPVEPGEKLVMAISVAVAPEASGPITDEAKVSGGGASPVQTGASNQIDPEPPFGFHAFPVSLTDSSAAPYAQAGGHPNRFIAEFEPSTRTLTDVNTFPVIGGIGPVRDPKDVHTDLPPGLIGNPGAVPRCSLADFFALQCPISTVIGVTGVQAFSNHNEAVRFMAPLFNLRPAGAYPGELGFIAGFPILLTAGLRSGSDYGLTITSSGSPEAGITRVRVVTWGVPADTSHDLMRGKQCGLIGHSGASFLNSAEELERLCEAETSNGNSHGLPAGYPAAPFLTMPTQCTGQPLNFAIRYDTYQLPADQQAEATATQPAVEHCDRLHFEPTIEARPTTNLADSPSGFDFRLKLPQNEAPEGLATADLKEAVVKLPPGLVVNPSSGAGLEGCSPAQIGLTTPVGTTPAHFTEAPQTCPDASKLGTVEVDTPLLAEPLGGIEPSAGELGAVYLATPHQNPSGGLLAGYIVLEGQGVIIKLAGQFHADPLTGQITASFLENPQTPFEEFKFHFFAGARGALRTPPVCGSYEVHSTLTPYSAPESGPPAEPISEFDTVAGPTGGACPTTTGVEPHSFVFHAGTESTQAGAYSPFSLKLVRSDGEQEIRQIETTLPEGLVGRLAGTTYCPDAALTAAATKSGVAEQQQPSCPTSSEVGSVDVTSGAGPTPLDVPGKAYLAGPYKGAPLSLAIVTPAVAGPFDLGDVMARTALYVDPFTTQITAKSDPIPTILEGIPLDVRSITLQMNKPKFTLNPTDCESKAITGAAFTSLGASSPLNQRFQVGGCPAVPFKPKLALRLKGSPKRAHFPSLTAILTMPPGDANIAAAQVTLPHSSFLAQAHIAKTCGRPELAAHTCPAASVYGHATAVTPLLDHPLEGPVYLATGFGYELPALVADLNGQIEVLLKGKVDSGRGDGIRNTFEVVPDAPVSKFTLNMFGGKKSLIENSEYLCGRQAKRKALARFTGQNGKTVELEPTVKNSCGKKHKAHHKRHSAHHHGHGKRHGAG